MALHVDKTRSFMWIQKIQTRKARRTQSNIENVGKRGLITCIEMLEQKSARDSKPLATHSSVIDMRVSCILSMIGR